MEQHDIYNKNGFMPIEDLLKEAKQDSREGMGGLEEKIDSHEEAPTAMGEKLVKEILTDKVKFFKQALKEIEAQIKDREFLKDTINKKLDERMCLLKTKTYEVDSWGLGNNKAMDQRRSMLENEIETLAAQKNQEEQQSWQDIALLRKEHRQFAEQFNNAMRRVKVVMPEFSGE